MKGDSDQPEALSTQDRRLVLVALFIGVFVFGMSFGGILPWIALALEERGTSPAVIGIVSAANPIGVMVMTPFVGQIMQRFGAANAIILGTVMAAITIVLMPVFDSTVGWIVLRFISGMAGAAPWVATETWINVVAQGRSRGRVVGLYTAFLTGGFAVGPLVLSIVGVGGWWPAIIFGTLEGAAIAPTVAIRRHSPRLEIEERFPVADIVAAMPAVFAAAFLSGIVDTSFFTFLPIWGSRMGLDQAILLILLSVFVAGNIVLPILVGWLADRIGTRSMMALCGFVAILCPVGAVFSVTRPILLGVILFVWGGAVYSLYSLAMIDIGHRCRGTTLAAASGALVIVYTISNVSGPPLTGAAIEALGVHSLMAVSGGLAAIFMLALAFWTDVERAEGR